MPRIYDREKIEMESETVNVLIHIGIMMCVSVFFIVYFHKVEQNPMLQDQILQNSTAIPIGQLLAFEGYFGYVILKVFRKWQQNIKLERTWNNAVKASMKMFHEYATWFIDFIAIYVITMEFFIYCYPSVVSDKALETSRIADLMFVSVLPGLALISHLLIRRYRLEKRN